MKKLSLFLLLTVSVCANAQEALPQLPPKKNVFNPKLPQLPQQPIKIDPVELPFWPNTIIVALTSHTWHLIRWWTTSDMGYSVDDISFKFLAGGVVYCSL